MNYSAGSKDAGPGNRLLRRIWFRWAAAVAAGSLLLASAGVVYADAISNNLDSTVDIVAEVMPLTLGGAEGSTTLYVVKKIAGDGGNGCTIQGKGEAVSLTLSSGNTAVATVTPASAIFDSCGSATVVKVKPVGLGTASISATLTSNTTGEVYDVAPVDFTVNVTLPPSSNTAPRLSISGVAGGASYNKGSVPAAVCSVTDAEDGPSARQVTLSAITGPDAAYGIGSQEATCDYTDGGGLYVKSSVTYNIIDTTGPEISYTLSPATPDGYDGWYRSEVYLDWTVTETDSTSTLSSLGCTDQLISLDQLPADYSCSATSSGGTSALVTVPIKKDGTAPDVALIDASGTAGNEDWYISDVTATFTATDATSGPVTATDFVTSSGEGSAVAIPSPQFTDNAGNVTLAGTVSPTFKIDKTAPAVSYTGVAGTAGSNGWYTSDVVATFTGTDDTSGPLTATKTVTSEGEGEAVEVKSPAFEDVAGNKTDAGVALESFKIDKTAPSASFSSTVDTGYFGSTAPAPTCIASDALSGLASCVVSGYGTSVGPHTVTATATDNAGNRTTVTQEYTVLAWTLKGFYQPVDMNGVLNTVKGGSTVPAKFEVFAGTRELTDPGLVSFAAAKIQCTLEFMDDVEVTATGNTSLRYDATGGQFIYNWKTPTGAGTCYRLTMTAADGSFITANFKLK